MGFYDCACGITGVSLKGADAAAVLLQAVGGSYRPIALALKGNYNRFGSIDGIRDGANARRVSDYFAAKYASGEFVVDEPYWYQKRRPIEDVENLLWGFERNTNDNPETALLNGEPVVAELVCLAVWEAIARAAPAGGAHFADLFAGVAVAEEMYREPRGDLAADIHQLAAVSALVAGHGLAWRPTAAGGQDFAEEMRAQLAAARAAFRDCPAVLAGLDAYEDEVVELLEDEE